MFAGNLRPRYRSIPRCKKSHCATYCNFAGIMLYAHSEHKPIYIETIKCRKKNRGKYALVDPADYYKLSEYKWSVSGGPCSKYYAVRRSRKRNGKRGKIIQMHREVANTPDGLECDHINGDSLDNSWNRGKSARIGYSKYKGITFRRRQQKWAAMICVDGKKIFLGRFEDEIEAAKAYDKAARKHFAEFAMLNFPDSPRRTRRTTKKSQ